VPALDRNYGIIVTGVGGTGVVTIGAILGMAAHLEGKGCGMIDMAGLAQKGGAVFSHVRLAPTPDDIHAIRVAAGQADLVLGCDLIVTGSKKVLAAVRKDDTAVICNTAEVMPGEFTRNADFSLPGERVKRSIVAANGKANTHMVDATAAAVALLGNAIAANMFMMGYAWQLGRLPLSRASLERAIALNGEAVAMNLQAFALGRRAAHDPQALAAFLGKAKAPTQARHISQSLDEMVARRVEFLTAWQDAKWAESYAKLVVLARAAEAKAKPGSTAFAEAVARYGFKLMSYKDEYEVARLYTDGSFEKQVAATFQGEKLRYNFHLAPPLLSKADPVTGEPRKMTFGPWMLHVFKVLAKLKGLRGTKLDIFGYTHERKSERLLIIDYHVLIAELAAKLDAGNHALAVALASIPEKIRGFGHVKERHFAQAKAEEADLLARFRAGKALAPTAQAAE
jgi:indolepyruvate ferredoxin oxidoreductase